MAHPRINRRQDTKGEIQKLDEITGLGREHPRRVKKLQNILKKPIVYVHKVSLCFRPAFEQARGRFCLRKVCAGEVTSDGINVENWSRVGAFADKSSHNIVGKAC